MPRGKKPETLQRDANIVRQLVTRASSADELAHRYGISRSRVYQIFAAHAGSDMPDDVNRDVHALRMDELYWEMHTIAMGPPNRKVSAVGKVVEDEEGNPIFDNAEKINAAECCRKIDAEIRRMRAIDLPRKKMIPTDEAKLRIAALLEQVRTHTVTAEVIPAIESGDEE